MKINDLLILKNLQTFSKPYGGLEVAIARSFINEKLAENGAADSKIMIRLKHPILETIYLQAEFPVQEDVTNDLLWVILGRSDVTAQLSISRNGTPDQHKDGEDYHYIREGNFQLKVSKGLSLRGVVERYSHREGTGLIRRVQSVPFRREWCTGMTYIKVGKEVTFLPVIKPGARQARCVEKV